MTLKEPQLDGLRSFNPSLAEKILICIRQVTMGAQNLTKAMVGEFKESCSTTTKKGRENWVVEPKIWARKKKGNSLFLTG